METQQFLNGDFGLEINEEEVSTDYNSPASDLEEILEDIMEFFEDEERRRGLEEYLDEEIPNPRKEWLDHRVKMAVSEPNYGDDIVSVFNAMLKYRNQQNGHQLDLEQVDELTEIDHSRLLEIKRFLVSELEICQDQSDQFEFTDEIMTYPEIIDQNL